jgi:hypothetical protein
MPRPRTFVDVLTEHLQKWARIYSIDRRDPIVLTEEIYALYGENLVDLTAEQLDAACRRAVETCKYFPKPADIRAQLQSAKQHALELTAEKSWHDVLDRIHWNTRQHFSAQTEHAIRAAGGIRYIERCSEEQLAWCRREFLRAYKNIEQTEQSAWLLTETEAKRMLGEVQQHLPSHVDVRTLPTPRGIHQKEAKRSDSDGELGTADA